MEVNQASCGYYCHDHNAVQIRYRTRLILSLIFVPVCIFLTRPFIARQIFYRASSYQACNLYQESIRQYRKALFLDGDNAEGWNDLATVYKIIGDTEKAILACEKALEIDPQNRKALYKLGMIMALDKQQYDEAIKYWSLAREAGPEDTDKRKNDFLDYYRLSLRSLATGYERLNDIDKATSVLEELIDRYPNDRLAKEKLKQQLKTDN